MKPDSFAYLPRSAADETRGLYVTTAGIAAVPAGSPYPPHGHPAGYDFDWQHGRVLEVYALIYMTHGEGTYESQGMTPKCVQAGDLIVLFPGVWHRYAPNPKTGWEERWLAFGGDFAARLMEDKLFAPSQPLLRIGTNPFLHDAYSELMDILRAPTLSTPSLAAAAAHRIIAQSSHAARSRTASNPATAQREEMVQRAKQRMVEQLDQRLHMRDLAAEQGVSYSLFRHTFKQHSGLSPKAYLIELRIERARSLLTGTSLSVKEVADQLSFETPYYFMRLFKNKTGMTPTQWRAYSRGQT